MNDNNHKKLCGRLPQYAAAHVGGAASTAGTAAAVPLLREVRQDKVLPYHILVKKIHKHVGDLVMLI